MVEKKKSIGEKEEKKGRVQVGKLKLNKETVKDLPGSEAGRIRGGAGKICSFRGTEHYKSCGEPEIRNL